jgi:demethylmenaquinone methyltransferase/2-methoxy-6-polyprenyl-1,4-benzoquinol methylase
VFDDYDPADFMPHTDATSPPSSSAAAWTATDLRDNPHAAPDKAERVRKMFAAIARRYDLNNRLHSFGRDQAWRREAVALCEVQPTDDVLDCACGTGDLTLAFAKVGPKSVTGLDFTAEMLEIARQKPASGVRTKPSFVQGDAMNLPFADASFDVVSIAWGIRNVAEPIKALKEFRRVLRPGGRLCVLEFSEPRNRVTRAMNRLYCSRIMPWTATLIARDRSGAYRYLPKSVADFPDPPAFARMIEQAGFPSPTLRPLTFGVCTIYLARTA